MKTSRPILLANLLLSAKGLFRAAFPFSTMSRWSLALIAAGTPITFCRPNGPTARNSRIPFRMPFRALLAAALSFTATLPARAALISNPSGDTYITQHSGLGGPTSNHALDASLRAIGTSTFLSYPLLQFDLSSLAGETVVGNATLSLYVSSGFGLNAPRTVNVYDVLIGWVPTTVTYNTFGASPGVQFGTDVGATAVASQTVGFPGMTPQYVSWTIPGAVIQNWIDNPSQNDGLLVRNLAGSSRDLAFASMEGTHQPELSVEAVPEPGTATAFFGVACLGLAVWRRRRRNNMAAGLTA